MRMLQAGREHRIGRRKDHPEHDGLLQRKAEQHMGSACSERGGDRHRDDSEPQGHTPVGRIEGSCELHTGAEKADDQTGLDEDLRRTSVLDLKRRKQAESRGGYTRRDARAEAKQGFQMSQPRCASTAARAMRSRPIRTRACDWSTDCARAFTWGLVALRPARLAASI